MDVTCSICSRVLEAKDGFEQQAIRRHRNVSHPKLQTVAASSSAKLPSEAPAGGISNRAKAAAVATILVLGIFLAALGSPDTTPADNTGEGEPPSYTESCNDDWASLDASERSLYDSEEQYVSICVESLTWAVEQGRESGS